MAYCINGKILLIKTLIKLPAIVLSISLETVIFKSSDNTLEFMDFLLSGLLNLSYSVGNESES